jgi:hypothetical protein
MGAPLGNRNAARAKKWQASIERALARAGGHSGEFPGIEATPEMKAMDEIADKFVAACMAGASHEKGDPWLGSVKEFGDRIDGKSVQIIAGDSEEPIRVILEGNLP